MNREMAMALTEINLNSPWTWATGAGVGGLINRSPPGRLPVTRVAGGQRRPAGPATKRTCTEGGSAAPSARTAFLSAGAEPGRAPSGHGTTPDAGRTGSLGRAARPPALPPAPVHSRAVMFAATAPCPEPSRLRMVPWFHTFWAKLGNKQ